MKSWVCQPCRRLEHRAYPLVRMAIGRPAAIACRESPVKWRIRRYPSRIRVFRLGIIGSGMATPAALTHSIAVIHSCLPLITFQLESFRILTNALDD
jgi:hypothetical protein